MKQPVTLNVYKDVKYSNRALNSWRIGACFFVSVYGAN